MTHEIQSIAGGLKAGCAAHNPKRCVNVEAGQVVKVVDALFAESRRADAAERELAALKAAAVPAAPAPETIVDGE